MPTNRGLGAGPQRPDPGHGAIDQAWTGPANDGDTVPMEPVARRTPTGWRVGDEELPDLTSAMVLADLLAADLPAEGDAAPARSGDAVPRNAGSIDDPRGPAVRRPEPGHPGTGAGHPGPGHPGAGFDGRGAGPAASRRATRRGAHRASQPAVDPAEAEQLRETVAQLERALTVRVRVEQAIGVLAERHRIRPRQAFELLRAASRSRGQRIMETATQVIASATNPLLRLPDELAKPPSSRRIARRSRGEA